MNKWSIIGLIIILSSFSLAQELSTDFSLQAEVIILTTIEIGISGTQQEATQSQSNNIDSNDNNASTHYMNTRPADFIQVVNTNGTIINETYIYLQDKLIAKYDNEGRKFFYHPDHLGSTSLVTNESGDVVEDLLYLPYGCVLTGNELSRFGYTGQEKDSESGFLDYGARQYDCEFSRFIQTDPVIADVYNPQNLNRYSYVLNNPYKYIDSTGNYVVQVGPTVTGAIGLPNVLGIGGAVGSGVAVSYVPGEGVQVGGYNINAVGVGGGAFAGLEVASVNLDRDTSLSDLAGSDKLFGIGGGQGIGVSAEGSIGSDSLPSIGVGAGGGIGGYIFESSTIIDIWYDSDEKRSTSDFISSEIKDKPRDDYYLQNLNPVVPQPPKQDEGGRRNRLNNNVNGNGNNGQSSGGFNNGGSNSHGSNGGCGSYMTCI